VLLGVCVLVWFYDLCVLDVVFACVYEVESSCDVSEDFWCASGLLDDCGFVFEEAELVDVDASCDGKLAGGLGELVDWEVVDVLG